VADCVGTVGADTGCVVPMEHLRRLPGIYGEGGCHVGRCGDCVGGPRWHYKPTEGALGGALQASAMVSERVDVRRAKGVETRVKSVEGFQRKPLKIRQSLVGRKALVKSPPCPPLGRLP
jgi:hypothetical protein